MTLARFTLPPLRLVAAVTACSVAGGVAYPHYYGDGPLVYYDPTVGYWTGAALGVVPGLLGHRLRVPGRAVWALAGMAAGLVALIWLIAVFREVVYALHTRPYRELFYGPYVTGPPVIARYGMMPAMIFGGLTGWLLSGRRERGEQRDGS